MDYIKQYGVLGMKWGVRRVKRDLDISRRTDTSNMSRKEQKKHYKEEAKIEKTYWSKLSRPKTLYKNRKKLPMSDINEAINRMDMEGQLEKLDQTKVLFGKEYVDRALQK